MQKRKSGVIELQPQ